MTNINIREYPYKLKDKDILFCVINEGNPVAKGRHRIGRYGNVYTPSETVKYEELLVCKIKEVYKSSISDNKSKFGLRCLFYRDSKQRIDCDNLIKCVADAISKTKIVWKDDNQCLEIIGRLFLASDNPRTEFVVYKIKEKHFSHKWHTTKQ